MRILPQRPVPSPDLRRKLERLDGLPLRPTTSRSLLIDLPEDGLDPPIEPLEPKKTPAIAEVDPGWTLEISRSRPALDPFEVLAARPWWPLASGPAQEALQRVWRHSVAVGLAARRLAREAGDADPGRIGRAGLLHGIGRWAVAALDPEWLAHWLGEPDPSRRLWLERQGLGNELTNLGRTLAERWKCDPLVVEAAWLHRDVDGGLNAGTAEPERLAIIQHAYSLAERTPWAISGVEPPAPGSIGPIDARVRLLVAEVQVRCASPFLEPDATPHEERLARSNARLRLRVKSLLDGQAAREALVNALADSSPSDGPETWAERAGLAWCGLPGIATARAVWKGPGGSSSGPEDDPSECRPATRVVPLRDRVGPCAEIHLWAEPDRRDTAIDPGRMLDAWQAWAALLAERVRLESRLEAFVRSHRERLDCEEPRTRQAKLAALAEFAAGAGHELNNPLAVIVGRAQLLLARQDDPDVVRSLRAILTQAQRAHRILRDLMFVARPPEPRPRSCQPEEVVKSCLRDLRLEAEARGVRILVDASEPGPKVWADPDALRHLADVLVRNALESTPKGGTVLVSTHGDPQALRWTIKDNGRGITPAEGQHLFDPFYCGRQAGRGLGLGLPRAARLVAQAGGDLRWHSAPGQGTSFQLHLPLAEAPRPPSLETESGPPASRNDSSVPRP